MSEPRIVTPQDAEKWLGYMAEINKTGRPWDEVLAHTVATEPDRTRAAVVHALRTAAHRLAWLGHRSASECLTLDADAIENGAPL